MHWGKKCSMFVLCLLTLFIVACGGSSTTPTQTNSPLTKPAVAPADKQIFRYPIGSTDFTSLDPARVIQIADFYVVGTLFTGLVELDDNNQLIDQMAASHQVSSDGLTYTFTLKPHLAFSDGAPITAQDVAYSINRTLLPATKSGVTYYLSLVKDYDKMISGKIPTLIGDSIIVKDPSTISIIISQPASYFLQSMTYPCTFVVEKKLIDKYGDSWTDHMDEGGTSGPFKVQSYSHTQGLIAVPDANYYGPKAKIQKVEYLISGDENTTYKSYLTNQYDWAQVPAAQLETAKTRKDYQKLPLLGIYYVSMNYLAKPFDNIKIRQAFALALNKDLIAKKALRGTVVPTNSLIPEGMPGYYDKLTGPDGTTSVVGNSDKAKQLLQEGLQEAGYSNLSQLPPITLTYGRGGSNDEDVRNTVTVMAQEWQAVLGITVQTAVVDSGTLTDQQNSSHGHAGPLQMWFTQWVADYPDPQDWLSNFFTNGGTDNAANYGQNNSTNAAQQQAIQAQLTQADASTDQAARIKIYNAAQQQIVNDVGWISIYQEQLQMVVNPKLQNYVQSSLETTAPDDWGNIYISQ